MRTIPTIILMLGLALPLAGCLGKVSVCLEHPVASGASEEALDQCDRALDDNLDNEPLFQHYMALLRANGRYEEIVDWSRQVLEHDSGRSDAIYHSAVGLRKTGKCEAAIAQYREFSVKNPEIADPFYGMGLCFEKIGDKVAAVKAYETYLLTEKREGQEQWMELARSRIEALGGSSADAQPQAATKPPPAPEPAPSSMEFEPEPISGTPAEAEPAPAPRPAPAPKPAPVAAPAPKPAPVAAPAPKPAPAPATARDCAPLIAAFSKDPFNTGNYEEYARCALAQKKYADVVKWIKTALRDNPGFNRGWLYLAEAYTGLGDAPGARFAYGEACKAGVADACGR